MHVETYDWLVRSKLSGRRANREEQVVKLACLLIESFKEIAPISIVDKVVNKPSIAR